MRGLVRAAVLLASEVALLAAAAMSGTAPSGAQPGVSTAGGRGSLPAAAVPASTLPNFGNPNGHVPVPPAGRAVDTSHPTRVIGDGSPADCTSAAVVRAVRAGGIITFDCGKKPVTIVMTATADVPKTLHTVVLDGRGLVTLSGAHKRRVLFSDTCAGTWSTDDCVNQPYPEIVVQNLTFEDGLNATHQATCTQNVPRCWYGGVDGGGAIYAEGGQFKAVNSRFIDNSCYAHGPDLGGGAIRVLAQYENKPVYITSDSFIGGRCSNGAALSSISVQWDVLNSLFSDNAAVGWGANPAAAGTAGGGSGGAIYNDGADYRTLVAGTLMCDNEAREGGGAIFFVVDSGWGRLTLDESHLGDDRSGEFQTYPGVYDDIDGHDGPPVVIHPTGRC